MRILRPMFFATVAALSVVFPLAAEELPYIAPEEVRSVPFACRILPGGAVRVSLGEASYVITSQYSLVPGWAVLGKDAAKGFTGLKIKSLLNRNDALTAETKSFTLERRLFKHEECLEVVDKITNLTDENLPLMVRYRTVIPEAEQYRLGGRKIYLKRGFSSTPENPTTIVITPRGSLGLMALDDVFRVHVRNFAYKDIYGVMDNNLVVRPRASHTIRLAIFPSRKADYYSQINAMRRFLGVNYRIEGPLMMMGPRPAGVKNTWGEPLPNRESPIEFIRDYITFKSARFVNMGRQERYKGLYLEGPDWLRYADADLYRRFIAKIKEAVPGTRVSVYFANNFYALPDGKKKYAGCELLNPDGSQADYRDPRYPLWLSVEGNAYARDLERTIDFIMNTIKTDAFYWDEFEHSAAPYHYGEPWDGVSADIDPRTHEIVRLKSSVTLLTQPWRVKMVKKILARMPLIVNGGPNTDTMTRIHFYRFTETGSISNCLKMHLTSPIALGDHITEKEEIDCYRCMLAVLRYGCVYYWYHDQVQPVTHETLTKYMYPITPVRLGEGYIIGRERIITARSGWFSFGDMSEAEAHFFDANGCEVERETVSVVKDDARYYKIVLAENESCALVRK